jgi:hypothetical protein
MLTELAKSGHKPFRGDIGVLRQAAASVNGAKPVSGITTREARNRLLLSCRDYR